jgi:predicted ArsR family transcriptional regulator
VAAGFDIRNNDVVKYGDARAADRPADRRAGDAADPADPAEIPAGVPAEAPADVRTRDRVAALLMEEGPATAGALAARVGCSATAIRRHLDSLIAEGRVVGRDARGPRGRGRPARVFALTDAGRQTFPHTYDDLASAALRYLAQTGGGDAVTAFAAHRVTALEDRCRAAMENAGDDPLAQAEALAGALSAEGYAASASALAGGGQLCQHHCPVAQVAAEFPQLCEAETAVIGRLLGSHVQRLATIAHGDGVCTTHIPAPSDGGARAWLPPPTRAKRTRPAALPR